MMITSIVGRLIKKPEVAERIQIPGKHVVNFTLVENRTRGEKRLSVFFNLSLVLGTDAQLDLALRLEKGTVLLFSSPRITYVRQTEKGEGEQTINLYAEADNFKIVAAAGAATAAGAEAASPSASGAGGGEDLFDPSAPESAPTAPPRGRAAQPPAPPAARPAARPGGTRDRDSPGDSDDPFAEDDPFARDDEPPAARPAPRARPSARGVAAPQGPAQGRGERTQPTQQQRTQPEQIGRRPGAPPDEGRAAVGRRSAASPAPQDDEFPDYSDLSDPFADEA
jgi:hypothetical protein